MTSVASGLADLFVALTLQNAEFMAGLEEATSAGEDFAAKFGISLDDTAKASDDLAGTADRAAEAVDRLAQSGTAAGDAAKGATDSVAGLADAAKGATDSTTGLTDSQRGLGESSKTTTAQIDIEKEALATFAEAEKAMVEAAGVATDALASEARAMATLRDVTGTTAEVTDASSAKVLGSAKADAAAADATGSHFHLMGLAAAAGAAISIKMAADFQQSMTRLVTSAGESQRNIGLVSKGILQMSIDTNTSTKQLASGMYYVESAGFHGAEGLNVLKAAAEGAQAEGADLGTVANAVTSALNAYGLKAKDATAVTDEMVAAVAHGKMTMQDLAGSISTVLPVAAKAGISIAQVTGAISTMTSQGMSAQQASLDLRHAIMSLQNPTSVQTKEMGQLGLNAIDVAKNIGKNGLTGTIQTLEEAILKNMGSGGTLLLKSFQQSKLAAQSATQEIAAMPKSIQSVAQSYLNGSISITQWNNEIRKSNLPANQVNLLKQFETTANAAHGFNDQLKAGGSDAQTFTAALSKMTGGTTGAQVALMVGGSHAAIFNSNVKAIAGSAAHAGANVDNWSLIQHNFNFQLGQAEKSVQAVGISFGQALLPAATAALHVVSFFATMIAHNSVACKALAVVVGVLLAGALEHGLAKALKFSTDGIGSMIDKGKGLIGFFRAGEDGVSGFGRALDRIGSIGQSVWSGLQSLWSGVTGLFSKATTATEAQTAAEEAATAATEAETAATEAQEAATEGATAAQEAFDAAADANPIGLIIVAIMALIAVIVLVATHWRDFEHWGSEALHAVEAAARTALNWIKSNWPMLLAILTGPIGLAVLEIVKHWQSIVNGAKQAWHDVVAVLDSARDEISHVLDDMGHDVEHWIDNVRSWIGSGISEVRSLIDQGWHDALSLTEHAWSAIVSAVEQYGGDALRWVEQLPGRILGALGDLGSLLYRAGVNAIEGLLHGMSSMVSSAISTVANWGHDIVNALGSPFGIHFSEPSEATKVIAAGQNVARGLAAGMLAEQSAVVHAANTLAMIGVPHTSAARLAGSVAGGDGAYQAAPAGGSGLTVQVHVHLQYGFVGSEQELATALYPVIQRATLDHGLYNGSTGLQKTSR